MKPQSKLSPGRASENPYFPKRVIDLFEAVKGHDQLRKPPENLFNLRARDPFVSPLMRYECFVGSTTGASTAKKPVRKLFRKRTFLIARAGLVESSRDYNNNSLPGAATGGVAVSFGGAGAATATGGTGAGEGTGTGAGTGNSAGAGAGTAAPAAAGTGTDTSAGAGAGTGATAGAGTGTGTSAGAGAGTATPAAAGAGAGPVTFNFGGMPWSTSYAIEMGAFGTSSPTPAGSTAEGEQRRRVL